MKPAAVASTFVVIALTIAAVARAGPYVGAIGLGTWKLASPNGMSRWLTIRKLPSVDDESFHVEILQSKAGDPAWKFTWLAPHLAITERALRISIVGRSSRLTNYPETYESAYRSWLRDNDQHREVCSSSVEQCLKCTWSAQGGVDD
jgi:hypothetical protein